MQDGVNGYLVPVEDPQQMAARILDVLQSSDEQWRQMSEASHRIAQEFNWERSAGLLESFLLEAVVGREAMAVQVHSRGE
jgi:glycosyltransferase involved in cell wall biosynthesis